MRMAQGFTLIEVSIALAIVSGMALFFASIYESISVASARNRHDQEVNDTVAQLKLQFSEFEDFCAANFAGVELNDTLPNGSQVPALSRVDATGTRVGDIFRIGAVLNRSGVLVDDIRIIPMSAISSEYMVAQLAIRMRRPNSAPGPAIERVLPIYAAVQNGRVVQCSAIAGNQMILRDALCRMQNGGFASYSVVVGYCVDDPIVVWAQGVGTNFARCPVGYVVSSNPDDPNGAGMACSATHLGVVVRARTYTNGERAGGDRKVAYSAAVDHALNECRFTFPPGENLANVVTHVRCVPLGAKPL